MAEVAKLFPQFEILELLGHGGMGAVYKARQPEMDRLVALKILPPQAGGDPGFAERFTREARALARLSHPNIVAVHEFGQADGLHYFIMEYVDGLNLRQLEQAGKLTPREALQIIPQICEALQFAHDEGIVHRDIKPENVMLDKKGRVKIADFGLARILGHEPEDLRLTRRQRCHGHAALHGAGADRASAGTWTTGRTSIRWAWCSTRCSPANCRWANSSRRRRKVQVDVRLDEVVLHALEKEPERRYQQASEVKTDVETIATTSGRTPRRPRRHLRSLPAAASPGVPLPPASSAKPVTPGSAKVTIPAVGLIVAGLLKVFSALTVVVCSATRTSVGWAISWDPAASVLPFNNPLFGWSIGVFKAIPALLMIYGGVQMVQLRSYAWSIAAGILGIVCCSFVGLPMGIWALIVLTQARRARSLCEPARFANTAAGQLELGCGQPQSWWRFCSSLDWSCSPSWEAPIAVRFASQPQAAPGRTLTPRRRTRPKPTCLSSAATILETPGPGDPQDAGAAAGPGPSSALSKPAVKRIFPSRSPWAATASW